MKWRQRTYLNLKTRRAKLYRDLTKPITKKVTDILNAFFKHNSTSISFLLELIRGRGGAGRRESECGDNMQYS